MAAALRNPNPWYLPTSLPLVSTQAFASAQRPVLPPLRSTLGRLGRLPGCFEGRHSDTQSRRRAAGGCQAAPTRWLTYKRPPGARPR